MPRYIDADVLYKETEKKIKANNEYGRAVVDGEFLDLINDAFTEDVVPRAEVAREIFAEIEEVFKKSNMDIGLRQHRTEINDTWKMLQRVREELHWVGFQVAKLKKKYTEGEQ